MTRGSYGTPAVPMRTIATSSLAVGDSRSFTWQDYGNTVTSSIVPTDYDVPVLAAVLADKWLEVATETQSSMKELLSSTRHFLTHLGAQPHVAGTQAAFAPGELRRRHLDAWEMDLLRAHRAAQSDTHYRHAVYLLALLARVEADAPGTWHPEVVLRLESDTRLSHHRNEGLPAFSPTEVRKMRGHAHRLVFAHLNAEPVAGCRPAPPSEVLVAAHVLLSLATGEPPEVLRGLQVADVVATAASEHDDALRGLSPSRRLTWLADRDLVDQYAVTYRKNRARETYQSVYGRHDHAAHRALTAVIRLTADLREQSGLPALWQQARSDGRVTEPLWNSNNFRLRGWLADAPFAVGEPLHWGRFRKVVVASEALANPRSYLNSNRRHSAQTFFGHYTNSAVLRAEAGRLLVDSASDMFQAALAGPTVVTVEAEELLAAGQEAPGLDSETGQALARGDLDGPQTACRDPKNSPFEPVGVTCSRSMTGTCFGCGNALITRHHLPAALAIVEVADPVRAADPQVWLDHWKPIYDAITQVILPAFPEEVVAEARERMGLVPLDLGTRNDMRGTDDDVA